jgi:MFS family permease
VPAFREWVASAIRPIAPPRSGLRRDLWVSTADAAAFSVMVGCGETYIPAFALELGMGPVAAGMTATVPVLAGACLQLVTPWGVRLVGTNRGWVIGCTLLQAASFIPMLVWAITGTAALWQLLVAASLYWSAGMAGAPAWNAWMGTMIPEKMRTPYFAQRNRLGQFAAFAGFVCGGLVLQWGESRGHTRAAFAVLFAIAAVFRLVSTACLVACRELQPPGRGPLAVASSGADADQNTRLSPDAAPRLITRVATLLGSRSAALVTFLWLFAFACQCAGPYFTPFMRRELGFSYLAFMTVGATSFLAKALALPGIGRLGSQIGSHRLLWAGALTLAPLTLLWLPSHAVPYLVGVQVVAGCCWACYELAVALLFFDAVPPAERTGLVTVYNLGHAVATVSGAATGAALLRWLGEDHTAYVCLFVLSACLRLAAVPLAWRIRIPHPEPVAPQGRDQPAAPQEGDQPVAPQGRGHSAAQPAVGNRSSCAMLSRKVRALP